MEKPEIEEQLEVIVQNFPEQEKLSGLLTDLKTEIAGIETNIKVENDMKPVADIVAKIEGWQKATVDAIRDIPEPETQNDYTSNFEALRSEIKAKKIDLLPIQKSLREIAKKEVKFETQGIEDKLDKLDEVLEAIKSIEPFEIPKSMIHKDNLKVSVDRVGGGAGGGAGSATEAKQDTQIANQLSQMMILIYENSTDSSICYSCRAPIGSLSSEAVWQIYRIDESVSQTTKYADNGEYTQIADNRESIIYT